MAIYFSCTQCGKALFAQNQYAGRSIVCPQCKASNMIPALPASQPAAVAVAPLAAPQAEFQNAVVTPASEPLSETPQSADRPRSNDPWLSNDPHLIDMERGPEPEAKPAAAVEPQPAQAQPLQSTPAQPKAENAAPADNEPTRKCPMCAETIKAAAKKCRFCGSILDEELRAQEELARRDDLVRLMVPAAERSTGIWRALAMMATWFTAGWLTFLSVSVAQADGAWVLIIFNLLLIFGLIWSARQMRQGPYNVFLATALAVMLCMPLNLMLGLPMQIDPQMRQRLIEQQHMEKWSAEQVDSMIMVAQGIFYFIVGSVFAIPIWIAMFKVAAYDRLRKSLGIKA